MFILSASSFAQSCHQDCFSALPVCSNSYRETSNYQGIGFYDDLPLAAYCFPNKESNAVWYIFTVSSPGLLQFDITPLNSGSDYDFMLFDLTNGACTDIMNGNIPPIRCNFANTNGSPTGLRAGFTQTSANLNGDPFLAPVSVSPNETYALLVDRWLPSGSGFDIDFSNSTASILDNVNPVITSVDPLDCDTTYTINVNLNELILCSSIDENGAQFSLSNSSGITPNVIGAYNPGCDTARCDSLALVSSITLVLDAPILIKGTHTISVLPNGGSAIIDMCGNPLLPGTTFDFIAPAIVLPYFDFTVRSSCASDTMVFNNISIPNTSNGSPTWSWDFGDGSTSTLQNPTHIFLTPQPFNITVSATTDDNCTYDFDTSVSFVSMFLASFDWSPKPVCPGETIKFFKTSNASATSFYWEATGPGINDISAQDTAEFIFPAPGQYQVYLEIMNNTGPSLCQADSTITITVNEDATAGISYDQTQICTTQPVQFIDSSTGVPTAWNWAFGNGDVSTEQNPTYTYTDTGTYTITLVVDNGCEPDTAIVVKEVNAVPVFELGNDTSICYQESVTLYGPSDVDKLAWSTGESTDSIVFTETPGEISLQVTNEGCVYEDLIYIFELEDGCIILPIPSAFSPNADGHNDVFRLVEPQRVESLEISIYNRWGERVFFDDRVDFYWDGTYKSELQDLGVFTWFIQGIGESGSGSVPFYRTGTVTLLR